MPRSLLLIPIVLAMLVGACANPPGGFHSPEPAARLDAILDADRARRRAAIPELIESLTHDDPLVRMAAIRALEDITGETRGYRYWAPEDDRRQAVQAWLDWYRRNPTPPPTPPAASPSGPIADTRPDTR